MKTFESIRNLVAAAILPMALLTAPPAHAFSGAGTVTLSGGSTTLKFKPQFFNQFPALGATLGQYGKATFQGNLNKQNLSIKFPLGGATLNPVRLLKDAFFDFEHQGGLLMTGTFPALSVVFNTPTLEAAKNCWASLQCFQFGATLIVNGAVLNYVPDFAQSTSLPNSFTIASGKKVNLTNIELFLTARGAELMNGFFGLPPSSPLYFNAGYPFATLDTKGTGVKVLCPPNTKYDKKYQQCI